MKRMTVVKALFRFTITQFHTVAGVSGL